MHNEIRSKAAIFRAAIPGTIWVRKKVETGEEKRVILVWKQTNAIAFSPYSLTQLRDAGRSDAEISSLIRAIRENPNSLASWLFLEGKSAEYDYHGDGFTVKHAAIRYTITDERIDFD